MSSKDTRAIIALLKKLNLKFDLIKSIEFDNKNTKKLSLKG